MAPSTSRLFTPVQLGGRPVHRVALAPLTRLRNSEGTQIPQADLAPEYYAQRASSIEGNPGLLITEATFIAREAGGFVPSSLFPRSAFRLASLIQVEGLTSRPSPGIVRTP